MRSSSQRSSATSETRREPTRATTPFGSDASGDAPVRTLAVVDGGSEDLPDGLVLED
jgi:hypothetical protein